MFLAKLVAVAALAAIVPRTLSAQRPATGMVAGRVMVSADTGAPPPAAGATLSELGALISPEKRTPALYGEQLDQLLSVLAGAAAGVDHAKADIRAGCLHGMSCILDARGLSDCSQV